MKTRNGITAEPAPTGDDTRRLPVVLIVGRANVGKSTLFNRITRRRAIVSDVAGTTRDLNYAPVKHDGIQFIAVDSGGLELGATDALIERVVAGARKALAAADLVLLVLDGRAGLSSSDREVLDLIRATSRPMIVAVNKIESAVQEAGAAEFYRLGAERLFFVSAAHGRGVSELLDETAARLASHHGLIEEPRTDDGAASAAPSDASAPPPDLRVALIGRPNTGKSSILNRLLGFERSIVSELPGTTRDPVDERMTIDGSNLLLVDTAGIRRRTRIEGELEHQAVGRALQTIRRADVLILVIDATEGITDQDVRLARLVETNDRALIVVCNKWDVAARLGRRVAAFVRDAHQRYQFLDYAPLLFTSALTGDGIGEILRTALTVGTSYRAKFQTAMLNRILADAAAEMDPPLVNRRRLNLMYVTQVASSPPRLVFFSNIEQNIPEHYLRFLETRFRAALQLSGSPLRFEFRRAPGKRTAALSGVAGRKVRGAGNHR